MKVFQNLELIQLNLDETTSKFYLPENTNLQGKTINAISFFAAPHNLTLTSPFDGRQLIDADLLQNFYVEVVKGTKTILHSKVSAKLSDITCSSRINVDSKIDLNLTNLTYVGTLSDLKDTCILCYFTFDDIVDNEYQPSNKIKAVNITTSATNTRLSDVIDFYISAQGDTVKCVEAKFDASVADNHFYLDLRDTAGRVFRLVPGERMMIATVAPSGGNNYYQKCYLADYNIDFKNSYIVRASSSNTMNVTLIFTY